MIWIFIISVFLAGLYVCLHYDSKTMIEGFRPRCPNVLIQNGNEIWLKNTNLADVPGVNPVVFHNLDEYTEFVEWQRSQGIKCPLLYLQKTYDAQNNPVYEMKPPPSHLVDASRDDPPYNKNSYPGIDPEGQHIGDYTMLDEYHDVGETQLLSANAMDKNWGGESYTQNAIKAGIYKGNEVLM
jgi:hypothetical protein